MGKQMESSISEHKPCRTPSTVSLVVGRTQWACLQYPEGLTMLYYAPQSDEVISQDTVFPVPLLLQVQLQLLTATVKLFLKKPTETVQRMIQLVLSCATSETDNPDLRDRAYVYWRLLSTDPEVGSGAYRHITCSRDLSQLGRYDLRMLLPRVQSTWILLPRSH